MILEATLNKLLRDTMNLILGISDYSIAAKQDAPRPSSPYGAVAFISDSGLGWEQHTLIDRTEDLDIDEQIEGLRSITMSMGFYKTGAVDNARRVRTGLVRQSIQDIFTLALVGLTTRTEVLDITTPLENGWEERAQFEVVLNVVGSDEDIIRSIQSVDIAGAFEVRGLTYNFNIEVP